MSQAETFGVVFSVGAALVGLVGLAVRLGGVLAALRTLREAHNVSAKEHREANAATVAAREADRGRIHVLELAKAASDVEQANTAKELAKLSAIIEERIPRRRGTR